jgi:plastocyanin
MKWLTRSIVPSMAAFAALIAFLPRTGPAVGLVVSDVVFTPQQLVVDQGEAITIRNDGDQTHSFTCPRCGFPGINIQPGQAKVATFPRAGAFEFWCIYHREAGMEGRVTVEGDAAVPATSEPEPTSEPTGSP